MSKAVYFTTDELDLLTSMVTNCLVSEDDQDIIEIAEQIELKVLTEYNQRTKK